MGRPTPTSVHWLGDRHEAEATKHATDMRGCVLYFERQSDCLQFMRTLSAAPPPPSRGEKEWRCFTCDELFTDEEKARAHFGDYKGDVPLCRMSHYDLYALRQSRDAFARRAEDADRDADALKAENLRLRSATPAPPMVTEEEVARTIFESWGGNWDSLPPKYKSHLSFATTQDSYRQAARAVLTLLAERSTVVDDKREGASK